MKEGDKELEELLVDDLIMNVYLEENGIWIQYKYAEKQKDTQVLSLKELECSMNSQLVNLKSVHSNISISNVENYIILHIKMQVKNSKNKNFF